VRRRSETDLCSLIFIDLQYGTVSLPFNLNTVEARRADTALVRSVVF